MTSGHAQAPLAMVDRAVEIGCKLVLAVSCTAIFLILLANVILRYSVGTSLEWASELPELLFPWFVVAGIVLATIQNAHIYIGFIVGHAGPGLATALGALRVVLAVASYGLLAWVVIDLLPIVADERTPIMGVPGSVTFSCLLLGLVLIALSEVSVFLRLLKGLRAPRDVVAYE